MLKTISIWTIKDWSKIFFSDESSFQLFPLSDGLKVKQRPGEAYRPRYHTPTVKFGKEYILLGGALARLVMGLVCLFIYLFIYFVKDACTRLS